MSDSLIGRIQQQVGRVQDQVGKIRSQFSHAPDAVAEATKAAAHKTEDEARPKSLAKGIIAGVIGGVAATAVKAVAERIYPTHAPGEDDSKEKLAEKMAGHPLDPETRHVVATSLNWTFGALTGAAYGALAEYYPAATAKEGATFGAVMGGLTTGGALPALGVATGFSDLHAREQTTEVASFVIFGTVTETVRRVVRRMI